MVCPCCREQINCGPSNPPRPLPESVSVSISVSLTSSGTYAFCANAFSSAVNGTYVLARNTSAGEYGYLGQFGNLRVAFTIDATGEYSLLQFTYCEPAVSSCGSFTVTWVLEQTFPTLCSWPDGGAGTVSTTDVVLTTAFSACVQQNRLTGLNDYTGSFQVSLL
jgi:hypothetical protein